MATREEIETKIKAFTREIVREMYELEWEEDFLFPFAAIESRDAELGEVSPVFAYFYYDSGKKLCVRSDLVG